jgi:hypothetical protein
MVSGSKNESLSTRLPYEVKLRKISITNYKDGGL